MAESKEELKSLLMKVKEESGKAALNLNIQKTKIMASGPIALQQIDGKTMVTVIDFVFLDSQITADGDCSLEIKRHLLLGRKAMTPPRQHIKKQRHYFTNKGPSSPGYGFSSGVVWMWELDCEGRWAPKNWCFWTVVLEKTRESLGVQGDLTSPFKWDQCWVFIGRLMLKLKLQYFGHLMRIYPYVLNRAIILRAI